MKTIELVEATASMADYARNVGDEPMILTSNGKPVAALVSLSDADWETISLSTNPRFLALIESSRAQHKAEGGVSGEEMRRRLAQSTTRKSRPRDKRPSPGDPATLREVPDLGGGRPVEGG